jgi:hypothetical protein
MVLKSNRIAPIIAFLTFGCIAQPAAEKLDLNELSRFGDAYLNRNIEVIAVITEAYQRKAAGNEGLNCMTARDMQSGGTILASPKDLPLGLLQRWAKDDEAIKLLGIVESRQAVNGSMYPSLMVRSASVVPKTELTNPLDPKWVYVSTTKHVDGISLVADSRNLLIEGKTVSLWARIDDDKPKRSSSGRPYLSEVGRYKLNCTGSSGAILATSQYEESGAAGRKVSSSLERRDVAVAPKTLEAALFEHIIYQCQK